MPPEGAAGAVPEVEEPDCLEAVESFVLQPHGRYQHSRQYVEAMLVAADLQLVSLNHSTLRYERQAPVAGLVVVARCPLLA